MIFIVVTSISDRNPPLNGPEGKLIPLRNNAAGKNTGFKVIMHNLSDEFFPEDKRRRGYNVSKHHQLYTRILECTCKVFSCYVK